LRTRKKSGSNEESLGHRGEREEKIKEEAQKDDDERKDVENGRESKRENKGNKYMKTFVLVSSLFMQF
jgi:hypothetical protein